MPGRTTRRTALAAIAGLALGCQAMAQGLDLDAVSTAKPAGAGPFPTVIVLADGAVATDALDRLRTEGILAVAPNVFDGDPSDQTIMQRIDAARDWVIRHGGDPARLGIVGFGPGGRAAWLYDAHSPAIKAAVSWYGPLQGTASPARPTTALDAAARLHAPLLGLHGKADGTPQRVLLEAESKAKQAGTVAEIVAYVGAGTDFAVPGTPSYDQAATLDGWKRTLDWFRAHGVR